MSPGRPPGVSAPISQLNPALHMAAGNSNWWHWGWGQELGPVAMGFRALPMGIGGSCILLLGIAVVVGGCQPSQQLGS